MLSLGKITQKKDVWGFVLVGLFCLGFVVVWGFWFVLAGLRFCSVLGFFLRDVSLLLLGLNKLWRDKHSNQKSNHFRHCIAKSQHKHIKICTFIQLQNSKGGKRTIHLVKLKGLPSAIKTLRHRRGTGREATKGTGAFALGGEAKRTEFVQCVE